MKKQYSVLMALNGLDIGGAETHVVELSKEMQRQIDRRVRKYRGQPEELGIGKVTKKISNMDWSQECKFMEFDDVKTLGKT